jgi:O-antigen/teichoic acid export membrane protein
MNESLNHNSGYSGRSIAKNTVYNLLGYGIPIIAALLFIPILINGLGEEKFGILNLAWMIIGYFSFFDFGIGKGLTKIVSEKISLDQTDQIPVLFWTSLVLMLFVSGILSVLLLFFVPFFVSLFNVSQNLKQETTNTFYILCLSIPVVSTTAGLRGVLEAYLQFGIINIVRIVLGLLTFVGPIVCLVFTNSLLWIVVLLIVIRLLIWLWYLKLCIKTNPGISRKGLLDFNSIKPVIKFSAWISLVNIIGPVILYSDRFLIGILISASAISYYAVSYEVVSKLLLISGALVGVLFPVFSASYFSNPEASKKIFLRGIKFIFLIIYPIVFLIVTFAFEGMGIWLGEKFAEISSIILQFLAIGIFFNSISAIPNNFFQGTGKPKIPAIINLIELPFYLLAMWFSIKHWGIQGAAITYMIAAAADALIMYSVARRKFKVTFGSNLNLFTFFLMIIILFVPFFLNSIQFKIIFAFVVLSLFIVLGWKHFLTEDERLFFKSRLRNV